MSALFVAIPTATAAAARDRFPAFIPFNPADAEFPEGVAVDKVGNVYVSIGGTSGPRGEIVKFTPEGDASLLTDFGTPGVVGLAVDAVGNVYAARWTMGVFKVTQNGDFSLVPGTENIVAANSLAFSPDGDLYITETLSVDPVTGAFAQGGIWRVPRSGSAELLIRDELLTGFPPYFFPFPVGANGIGFYHHALYVANTDKALVLKIDVRPKRNLGPIEVWKHVEDVPESFLLGVPEFPVMVDGLALDVHGNVYLAVPSRSAVVRINAADGSQDTIAAFPQAPLDSPLSLAFGSAKGQRDCLFITNGGMIGLFLPGTWPGPGLIKVEAGIAGLPLP